MIKIRLFLLLSHIDSCKVIDISKKRGAFILVFKKLKTVAAPLLLQLTLTKKALWSFKMSTIIYNSTRCNTLEDSNLNSKNIIGNFFKKHEQRNFLVIPTRQWKHPGSSKGGRPARCQLCHQTKIQERLAINRLEILLIALAKSYTLAVPKLHV